MRTKRKPKQQQEPARMRDKDDPFWCEWTSTTHAPCHKLADPGLPFCLYHIAATFGMARGASAPDAKTRALFDQVIDYYDEREEL